MNRKTRSTVLFILFAFLCVAVLAAGLLAVRFTQGTAQDGDGAAIAFLAVFSLIDILLVRILY